MFKTSFSQLFDSLRNLIFCNKTHVFVTIWTQLGPTSISSIPSWLNFRKDSESGKSLNEYNGFLNETENAIKMFSQIFENIFPHSYQHSWDYWYVLPFASLLRERPPLPPDSARGVPTLPLPWRVAAGFRSPKLQPGVVCSSPFTGSD